MHEIRPAGKQIIRDQAIVNDDWNILRLAEGESAEAVTVGGGKWIVPLKVWQAQQPALQARAASGELGLWLASDEQADALKGAIHNFPVIAVEFPKFSDGRGFSLAYNLRARLGFEGELRAFGDVLRDQMFYMQRVGFNAFEPRTDRNIADALKGLFDFSVEYQASLDQKFPLFRRVQRVSMEAR
jgi:uncharacterized protein (DUF934 family)